MSEDVAGRFEERWRLYRWRLIRGEPVAPPMNVAIDEVLTRRVGSGERAPTLRFWGRYAPEVVIGRFQSVGNEVDEEATRELGVEVIRRTTGGGAMFVEPKNIITYSLYAPLGLVAGMTTVESYAFLDGPFVEAKEVVGGFMIISAEDYDGAVEVVRACPAMQVPGATMEIREMVGAKM